jgi:hypothetical protein
MQQMNELNEMNESLTHQLESSNTNDQQTIFLRERLSEEERKNLQLQQFVQQLQQQKSSLINQLSINSNSNNFLNGELNLSLNNNSINNDSKSFTTNNNTLLMEAKDSRMKQLENQVNQLQEELNATKNSINRNHLSNESYDITSSIHVSPQQHQQSNHLSPASSNSSQLEQLRANEKFFKEKVIYSKIFCLDYCLRF